MNRSGAGALMLGTLLLAVGCESQPNTVTAPSTSGPATQPQPPQPPPPATNFEVTGVVTSEQGVPVAGAVVTMANGPYSSWPSTVSDGSGGYRIAFSATSTGSGFVARAQVIAEGYELYWRSLFTNSFANNNVESFRRTRQAGHGRRFVCGGVSIRRRRVYRLGGPKVRHHARDDPGYWNTDRGGDADGFIWTTAHPRDLLRLGQRDLRQPVDASSRWPRGQRVVGAGYTAGRQHRG